MNATVDIIVPAYNEQYYLPATLARLNQIVAGMSFDSQVIVVDNASTDQTARIAHQFGAQVVFEKHRQIARARNAGARAGGSEFLIFVDADTLVSRQLIAAGMRALQSGQVCGGGAQVQFTSHPAVDALAAWGAQGWNLISRTCKWACGAFMFCRRDAFEAVGGFDEQLYAGEEIFFSRAIRKWGRRRGKAFIILNLPIQTSARKLEWYSARQLLWMSAPILIYPWLLRSRRFCRLWYNRPG